MQVNIEKKHFYFLVGIVVIIGIVLVIAQTAPNPGHDYREISTCADG